jgi:hypothetical protein
MPRPLRCLPPLRRSWTPAAALTTGLAALLLALLQIAAFNPTPLAGDPRPPLGPVSDTDRFVAPHPVTSEAFATFPVHAAEGAPGLWLLPRQAVPLRFQVEREIADRFGLEAIEEAVEVFNDVPGTRFGAEVAGVVDDGVDERRRDGVNRIFLDRQGCGDRFVARAHLWSDPVRIRGGRAIRDVREVDIGLCERLSPAALDVVVRHELAHIAGLDHLCDPDEDCHRPGMAEDNRCRIMYPRMDPCQELERGDLDGLVHLYPNLPRAGGGDARSTAARVARVTHPVPRSSLRVVVSAHDAPPARQVLSATLAGHLGLPHVLVDADCTAGPDGQALNHTLALTGTVTAVGEIPDSCRTALELAWQLEIEDLTSTRQVVAEMVDAIGGAPSRVVIAPPAGTARELPLSAQAAAAAVALHAPLVVLPDVTDMSAVVEALEDHPTIAEVVVFGDTTAVPNASLTSLAEADVAIRRLGGEEAADVAAALVELPQLRRRHPLGAAVVGDGHPEHAAAGVSLAVAVEGLVLPVSSPPSDGQLELLDHSFTRGAIVGGLQAVSSPTQRALSRALDGDR